MVEVTNQGVLDHVSDYQEVTWGWWLILWQGTVDLGVDCKAVAFCCKAVAVAASH